MTHPAASRHPSSANRTDPSLGGRPSADKRGMPELESPLCERGLRGVLSIIPTPIGNLSDITLRALEALKSADLILCEDTRHTGRLLAHYQIQKPLWSFHEYNEAKKAADVLKVLREGRTVVLVSDAGTPLVSDPGYKLVREVIREGLPVTALPGANAAVTALVLSGLPPDAFSFYGFLPKKSSQRKRFFETLKAREETLIFYESPYRVLKALGDMLAVFGDRDAAVCREISKKFEETLRGKLSELIQSFGSRKAIGEFVIVVGGHKE